MEEPLDIRAFAGEKDGELLIAGLQALHRERVSALRSVELTSHLHGTAGTKEEIFGLDEVHELLRRVGATTSHF